MKKRQYQRGSHHIVLIVVAVVTLVGVLGFVGFNAWQKKTSNAYAGPSLRKCSDLGRIWSGGKCQKHCRVGAGRLRTNYPYDYCDKVAGAGSGLTHSKCSSLGRVWRGGACIKHCKSIWYHIKTESPYDRCVVNHSRR